MARQATQNNIIPIDHFNFGGLSHSKWSGQKYSLYKLTGYDPHTLPGILQVEQKMTAETTGAEPDEFCKAAVNSSNGAQYWASSTTGKIWERPSGGTWRLVHTITPSAGSAAIVEMTEYQGYIYILTQSRIHRILVTDADDNDWANDCVEDWGEMNLSQTIGGIGATGYTNTNAVNEGATHKQTFTALEQLLESVSIKVLTTGTGNLTVTVHDASNNVIGSKQILNASLVVGTNIFEFATPLNLLIGSIYHVHVHSSVADGTSDTNVSGDLEGALMSFYRTSNATYHPTHDVNLVLYIGDNNYVHQIDGETFSREALDIEKPLIIVSLGEIVNDLLVGTYVSSTVNKARIIRWDTFSVSFTSSDPIPENAINAFLPADNMVLVQCGTKGNIYYYDGENLELYMKIPGEYSQTAKAVVYNNSVANREGQILFGLSNVSGNPADQGIYRIGRHSRDYDYIMDLPYPISERSGSDFVLTGLSIGAILVVDSDVYMSWKNDDGTPTYGVDKLDSTLKLDGAYFETMIMTVNREAFANIAKVVVSYADLPASTVLSMYLNKNYDGYGSALTTIDDTDRNIIEATEAAQEFTTLQLKVKATTSVNTAPRIESAAVFLE